MWNVSERPDTLHGRCMFSTSSLLRSIQLTQRITNNKNVNKSIPESRLELKHQILERSSFSFVFSEAYTIESRGWRS